MYVGRRMISTVTVRDILSYTCKHCEFRGEALVTAVGQGQGQSPFFLDNEGAANRASERAERDAREKLVDTIGIATCPSCGKRDASAVRGAYVWAILLGLGLAAVCWGVFFVLDLERHRPLGLTLRAVASAGVFAGVLFLRLRAVFSADKRVQWTDVPKVKPAKPRQPLPEARAVRAPSGPQDPYRAPPASAPIAAIATAKAPAPAPIVDADPANKPTFLT